jgi:hypothetical protein
VSDHECYAGLDPRKQGSCVRCGRVLPPPPVDLCDEEFETQAALVAARQAGVDGRAVIAFARARKMPGVVKNHTTRDFRQEVAEELADGSNYLLWWMEQARANGTLTNEKQWHLMQALGAVAVAWHHIESAHQT